MIFKSLCRTVPDLGVLGRRIRPSWFKLKITYLFFFIIVVLWISFNSDSLQQWSLLRFLNDCQFSRIHFTLGTWLMFRAMMGHAPDGILQRRCKERKVGVGWGVIKRLCRDGRRQLEGRGRRTSARQQRNKRMWLGAADGGKRRIEAIQPSEATGFFSSLKTDVLANSTRMPNSRRLFSQYCKKAELVNQSWLMLWRSKSCLRMIQMD